MANKQTIGCKNKAYVDVGSGDRRIKMQTTKFLELSVKSI